MPELPEVENFRKYLEGTSLSMKVVNLWIDDPRLIKPNKRTFVGKLKGNSMVTTDRIGKYLFAGLSQGGTLVMHFGLTGSLNYFNNKEDMPKYTRVLFEFAGGSFLAYICKRKFGWVAYEKSQSQFVDRIKLGTDATQLTFEEFYNSLHKRNAPVKTLLLNQSIAAGVGNWIADEILYQAKIHPETKPVSMDRDEIKRLHQKLKKIINLALKAEADFNKFPKYFLIHNREKGGKCFHTGKPIKRIVVGGRGTFISPTIQKKKK